MRTDRMPPIYRKASTKQNLRTAVVFRAHIKRLGKLIPHGRLNATDATVA